MTTNFYYGLARGQNEAEGSLVVVGTSSNGTSSDVELRVQTVNGSTNTGITVLEVLMALECFENYLLNLGLESLPGTDIPNQTLADHL